MIGDKTAKKRQIKVKKRNKKPIKDERFFAISDSDSNLVSLTLITPDLKYRIGEQGIVATERVKDYDAEVRSAMKHITERALVGGGFYSGSYKIQFNHNEPVGKD